MIGQITREILNMATSSKKTVVCSIHDFVEVEELHLLRSNLLDWYDSNKRTLPWRTVAATEKDANMRAYAVWVSEIMLQQTQVATVVDYYNRWMKKWSTVTDLASANREEVMEMWTGLGYYSRAQRLWEGAQKVVTDFGGQIPGTADELMKSLPGVGRYTANAIASIAFGERCGVVDGNVVRVFSRLRAVGACSGAKQTMEHFWKLAQTTVDEERPGDFNQAMMELGATVCTPKSPHCKRCPLNTSCNAYKKVLEQRHKHSLERYTAHTRRKTAKATVDHCPLCLPSDQQWDPSLGVMNYPRKAQKKPPTSTHFAVGVIESTNEGIPVFLIRRRPETGLLAGLWEFPSIEVQSYSSKEEVWQSLLSMFQLPANVKHNHRGTVVHQFSHILHHYHVWHITCTVKQKLHMTPASNEPTRWVTHKELMQSAISTAVKKIYNLLGGEVDTRTKMKRKCTSNSESEGQSKRQKKMDAFLKTEME